MWGIVCLLSLQWHHNGGNNGFIFLGEWDHIIFIAFQTIGNLVVFSTALRWRHNVRDSVSNHQPYHSLLSRFFGRRTKKHQSFASLAFVRGIHRGPVNSPRKWPVTRKIFPFDDVIMACSDWLTTEEIYNLNNFWSDEILFKLHCYFLILIASATFT